MESVSYRHKLAEGINIYLIKEPKFKTVSLNVFIYRSLDNRTSENALLPHVLRRGCADYPDIHAVETFLGKRYGASLDVNIAKKGDIQLLHFNSNVISNKYTLKGERVVGEILEFMIQLITMPLMDSKGFRKDYFEQEKENLRKMIRARINDKIRYSVDRCYEEMCKGQPFSRYIYGSEKELERITNIHLRDYYMQMLEQSPIDIFVVGDVDADDIEKVIDGGWNTKRSQVFYPNQQKSAPVDGGATEIIERMDINQGKISMGYTTGVGYKDDEYVPMLVYASILGGGPHSKLFNNVRERASLAYYSMARLEKFKGLMLISSGIEISNYRKAVDIINRQLQDIAEGSVYDYELDGAKKSLINGVLSMKDNQMQIVDFLVNKKISGHQLYPETIIRAIEEISADKVSQMAQRVRPGITYFLTSIGDTKGEGVQ